MEKTIYIVAFTSEIKIGDYLIMILDDDKPLKYYIKYLIDGNEWGSDES